MYKAFGFSDNIFNVRPLRPIQEDAKKFVGRRTDLNSFMVDIASEDKAVAVVTGHRGIGKTSFVNIMEYAASLEQPIFDGLSIHESRILPCFHKIQIEPGETVKNLLFKAISSLLFSVKEFCFETQKLFPADLEDLLSWVSEVVPTTGRALGLTAGPVGGSRGTNRDYRSFADISSTTLCEEIKKIIGKIREHLEMKGAFLNLNNLEIIEEEEFIGLMNQLRDYLFEIDGLWVILIGYPGMYSTLAMKAARVSEIISGQETFLAPLTEDEVLRILEIRRKTYRMDPDHPPPPLPLEENFIRAIYRNSDGEIRSVFKACDDIARAVFKENPTIQGIKEGIGRVFLKEILGQQLNLFALKSKEREILDSINVGGPIRPKEYERLKLKSMVEFTNRARPLLEKNLLRKTIEGNAAIYDITGIVRLGLYAGLSLSEKD